MTLNQRDIFQWFAPRSGIQYGNPVLEWIQAAHWGNQTYEQFEELSIERQIMKVAAYRTEKQIESVLAHKNKPRKK